MMFMTVPLFHNLHWYSSSKLSSHSLKPLDSSPPNSDVGGTSPCLSAAMPRAADNEQVVDGSILNVNAFLCVVSVLYGPSALSLVRLGRPLRYSEPKCRWAVMYA